MDAIPVTPTVTLMIPPRPGARPREVIVDLDTVTELLRALEAAHAALETTQVVLNSIGGGGIVVDATIYCGAVAPHSGRECTLEAHDGAHHESHIPGRPLIVWDDEPGSDEAAAATLAASIDAATPVVTEDEPDALASCTRCWHLPVRHGPQLGPCEFEDCECEAYRSDDDGNLDDDEPPPWPDVQVIEAVAPLDRSQLRAVIRDAHDLAPQAVERALATQRDPGTWTRDGEHPYGPRREVPEHTGECDGFCGGRAAHEQHLNDGGCPCCYCARYAVPARDPGGDRGDLTPVSYLPLSSERLHGARIGGTS